MIASICGHEVEYTPLTARQGLDRAKKAHAHLKLSRSAKRGKESAAATEKEQLSAAELNLSVIESGKERIVKIDGGDPMDLDWATFVEICTELAKNG